MAYDKRRLFTALGTHTSAHLDANGLFFSSDGHQSLIPTGQIDWEKGVSHWIHDSGCRFLRSTHAATNSNRGRVLPSQIRNFPHLDKDAIDSVIVFIDLSSKVLLRVFRTGVGHLLCRLSANLVRLSDSKAALARIGFSSDSNGGSRLFEFTQPLSFSRQDDVSAAQFFYPRGEPCRSIDNSQWLVPFEAVSKTFQNSRPTGCDDQIITIMVVAKAEDHCCTLGKTMLNQGPYLRDFSTEKRLNGAQIRPTNVVTFEA